MTHRARHSFPWAIVGRLSPIALQFSLLIFVGREGELTDVGILSAASATAYLCASLAEGGFQSSMATPLVHFGSELPPLRATRTLRLGLSVLAAATYGFLVAIGLGRTTGAAYVLVPFTGLLVLGFAHTGALNALGRIRVDGRVALTEFAVGIAVAVVLSSSVAPTEAAFCALLVSRTTGVASRAAVLRGVGRSAAVRTGRTVRTTVGWTTSNALASVRGQADLVVLGLVGAVSLAAVYAPLMRASYFIVVLVEAVTWSLYGSHVDQESITTYRRWVGPVSASLVVAYVVLAEPALQFLINPGIDAPTVVLIALGGAALFCALSFRATLPFVRSGRQLERAPGLAISALIITGVAILGAARDNIEILAVGRLSGELALLCFLAYIGRRLVDERVPA